MISMPLANSNTTAHVYAQQQFYSSLTHGGILVLHDVVVNEVEETNSQLCHKVSGVLPIHILHTTAHVHHRARTHSNTTANVAIHTRKHKHTL